MSLGLDAACLLVRGVRQSASTIMGECGLEPLPVLIILTAFASRKPSPLSAPRGMRDMRFSSRGVGCEFADRGGRGEADDGGVFS